MPTSTIITILGELSGLLLGKVSRKRGTLPAQKSYERKAYRDYRKATGARMRKDQRIPETMLFEIASCKSIDAVRQKLSMEHSYPPGYVKRFLHIWAYYEQTNVA